MKKGSKKCKNCGKVTNPILYLGGGYRTRKKCVHCGEPFR
jgi:hypothetical protein